MKLFIRTNGQSPVLPSRSTRSPIFKLNKEWDWIIGSGIYVDDVEADVAQMRWQILGGTLLLSLLILSFAWVVSRRIKKALDKAISVSEKIAGGDLTGADRNRQPG